MQVCDSPNKIGFNPSRKHFQVEDNESYQQSSSFTDKRSLRINKLVSLFYYQGSRSLERVNEF